MLKVNLFIPLETPTFVRGAHVQMPDTSYELFNVSAVEKKPLIVDLKTAFKNLYYYLYTNSNTPRYQHLIAEVIRLLHCKIFDETQHASRRFFVDQDEPPGRVMGRITALFLEVKTAFPDLFEAGEKIELDEKSVAYVVEQLQAVDFRDVDKDAIGTAFEAFLGPKLRGDKGQFFTPRSVVKMAVDLVSPLPTEKVIDPACGSGGFLTYVIEYMKGRANGDGPRNGLQLFGIDKDADLAKLTRAHLAIVDGRSQIYHCDSLDRRTWKEDCVSRVREGGFDVVLTNPPFGSRIPVTDKHVLRSFDLGHRWTQDSPSGQWSSTGMLLDGQDPQVLFLELCIRLLKPGGRLAIVLPEGLFGNRRSGYILDYVRSKGLIAGIIDCPRTLFQPSTDIKTNVLFFKKKLNGRNDSTRKIFFSVVLKCGHDRRGRPHLREDGLPDDEFPLVSRLYHSRRDRKSDDQRSRLGFLMERGELEPYYLIPRYYDPELKMQLAQYASNPVCELKTVEELIREGLLSLFKGDSSSPESYGEGDVPFIRTSDVTNWEITHTPNTFVTLGTYRLCRQRQQLREGDLLFVNDGRYRIGSTCILTSKDTEIVVQGHFRILRCERSETLSPFLLLYLMKSRFVQLQIRAKTFVQSTIATLGPRIKEIALPIPRDLGARQKISEDLREIVEGRARLLQKAKVFEEECEIEV